MEKNLKWNDIILVERLKNGDQSSANILYKRYYNFLLYFALPRTQTKEDAEDVVALTFLKAFTKIDLYTPEGAFSTWLNRILINTLIDFYRKKRIKALSIEEPYIDDKGQEAFFDFNSDYDNPEESLIKKEKHKKIREIVNNLPEVYRNVINHIYFEGLQYEEAAKKDNIPLGTVKGRLHRGKKLLKKELNKKIKWH